MKRAAVALAAVFFVAMVIGVTFPGVQLFNTIRPLVFGVPFVFVWYLAWILGAFVVFLVLYRVFQE